MSDATQAETEKTDVVIVGAGPVGLFAVFELGMLQISATVIDPLEAPGGQLTALYPEKPIYDIPGYPRIDAYELVEKLLAQAAPFEPAYRLGERVEGLEERQEVEAGGDRFLVTTSAGRRIACKAVIIAAGAGAFGPNRPPLPGLEAYEGESVFYLVKRRDDFAGKRVVIAGGGDSAVDWAISLAEVAAQVMVVHRRAKFRAAPESVARMERLAERGMLELVVPYQLDGLVGEKGRLSAVKVATLEGEVRNLPADALLAFFGLSTDLGPIAGWGLALERHHLDVAQATSETSRKGIFAIGDVAHYEGKLKLILTGFAEAAAAAHAIHPLVHPDRALHWEYSTTKGVPGREAES